MPPKLQIIGNEDKAIPYIQWAKSQWNNHESGTWYKHTGDCLIQFIRNGDDGFIRFIPEESNGILVYPKTGSIYKEYQYAAEVAGIGFDDGVDYAFIGDDLVPELQPTIYDKRGEASLLFLMDEDATTPEEIERPAVGATFEFGNISAHYDGEDIAALSWKSTYCPGIPHIILTEPFGPDIYEAGGVLDTALGSVLGAGYIGGVLHVVYMQTAGIAVAKKEGEDWIILNEFDSGRIKEPCIIEDSSFVFADGSTIIIEDNTADYKKAEPNATGTHEETGSTGSYYSYGADLGFTENAAGTWNGIAITLAVDTETESDGDSDSANTMYDIVWSGSYPTQMSIGWNTIGTALYVNLLNGIHCDISWSVPSGLITHFDDATDPHHKVLYVDGYSGCVSGFVVASADTSGTSKMYVHNNVIWVDTGEVEGVLDGSEVILEIIESPTEGMTRRVGYITTGIYWENGGLSASLPNAVTLTGTSNIYWGGPLGSCCYFKEGATTFSVQVTSTPYTVSYSYDNTVGYRGMTGGPFGVGGCSSYCGPLGVRCNGIKIQKAVCP